jgi:hypothetical protein
MASAGLGYGESKFGQTYTMRALLALLVLGALAGAWASVDDPRPAAQPILFWISVGAVLAWVAACIAISKTVLTISDHGVRRESILGAQEMAWSQVAETRYLVTPISAGAHFGLAGVLVSALFKSSRANLCLTLIGVDGKKIKVTSNFQKAKEAIGIILGRINPAIVSRARVQIQRGETVRFGELALSPTLLTWKTQAPIPVSDLGRAEIVGKNLRIKRNGKWLDTVSVRSDKIPNVLVFLEVLDSVAPQLKSPEVDPLARVRV